MLELRFLLDAMKNLHHEYDGLIFDLDGTLADTMPAHFAAWSQSMAEHGLVLSEERFYALGGVPASEIIELLAKEQGKVVDAVAIAEEKKNVVHGAVGRGATSYPGASNCRGSLRASADGDCHGQPQMGGGADTQVAGDP